MPKFIYLNGLILSEASSVWSVSSISGDFTATASDCTEYRVNTSSGIVNATLPAATQIGLRLGFRRNGANFLNVLRAGSDVIESDTNVQITEDKALLVLVVAAISVWEIWK